MKNPALREEYYFKYLTTRKPRPLGLGGGQFNIPQYRRRENLFKSNLDQE